MRSLVTRSMNAATWLSGSAPRKPSTGCPLTKANTAGIDWIPSCPGIEGCLSMSILTSLTLPLAARTTFSNTGPSCLQGPHHSAQKSTSTGWRLDSSITSLTKVCVVVSLTTLLGAAASPLCNIVMSSVLRPCHPHRPPSAVSSDRMSRSIGPFNWASQLSIADPGSRRPAPKTRICPIKWCQRGCLQSINSMRRRRLVFRDCQDPGRMAGGFEEPYEVRARDRRGHGVDQGMTVDGCVAHQGGIEHNAHAPLAVVHRRERRDRAGLDAERCAQEVGGAEREAAGGGEAPVQRFQLDHRILERRDQEQRPLLVLEEQVLGVAARNGSAQLLRLLDGEQRGMRHRRVGDAEPVEEGEEVGRSGGHGI